MVIISDNANECCKYGLMDRQLNIQLARWLDGMMAKWLNGQITLQLEGQMARWICSQIAVWQDGWVVIWVDGQSQALAYHLSLFSNLHVVLYVGVIVN